MSDGSLRTKRGFPPSTVGQLLLLMLFLGLAIATWMRTKALKERFLDAPDVEICNDAPLAAITWYDQVRVIDWTTGETKLRLGPNDLPGLKKAERLAKSQWYLWPGSPRLQTGAADLFPPDLPIPSPPILDLEDDEPFEKYSLLSRYYKGSIPLSRFTKEGKGVVVRTAAIKGEKIIYSYLVVDLASGKRTAMQNEWLGNDRQNEPDIRENLVVIATEEEKFRVIDPAIGVVDTKRYPQGASSAEKMGFPLAAMNEEGEAVEIDLRYEGTGMSVLLRKLGEGQNPPTLLHAFDSTMYLQWVTPHSALVRPDVDHRSMIWSPFASSPIWRLQDRPPLLERLKWPGAEEDLLDQLSFGEGRGETSKEDGAGAMGRRLRRKEDSFFVESTDIYWDFQQGRVTPMPNTARRLKRCGDRMLLGNEEDLQVVDLASGRVERRISLDLESRPPLGWAWAGWLLAWVFFVKPTQEKDFSRTLGALIGGGFLVVMWLAFLAEAYSVGPIWLTAMSVLSALAMAIGFVAARRAASLAVLGVCGMLVCAVIASCIHFGAYQRSFNSSGIDPPAIAAWKKIAETANGEFHPFDSLLNPLLGEKVEKLPTPQWVEEEKKG